MRTFVNNVYPTFMNTLKENTHIRRVNTCIFGSVLLDLKNFDFCFRFLILLQHFCKFQNLKKVTLL